jgi:formate hydrogenlyase subunit 4
MFRSSNIVQFECCDTYIQDLFMNVLLYHWRTEGASKIVFVGITIFFTKMIVTFVMCFMIKAVKPFLHLFQVYVSAWHVQLTCKWS